MKNSNNILFTLFFFAAFLYPPMIYADLAPTAPWDSECGIEDEFFDVLDCKWGCYWDYSVNVQCQPDPQSNRYFLHYFGDRERSFLSQQEWQEASNSCRRLKQFGDSLPSVLKSLKKLISNIVSKPPENCSSSTDLFVKMNCSPCTAERITELCARNQRVEKCVRACLEAEQCIDNYKKKHFLF